ncbi:MAG: hypothetical protein PWQ91_828 [Eubacteriales bacterium]|nr:hypothetical protein [Eubacteriales bacterium]MDN5363767.1 hypothetical protein [Eubacteriales bacterium]
MRLLAGEKVFALDIGTRTVVGIVAVGEEEGLKIKASDYLEHRERAMLDGQIHDVELVARAVKTVKECLERKTGEPLKEVAVAAAGRVLKTLRCRQEEDYGQVVELDRERVLGLELQAVQAAQRQLAEEKKDDDLNYHCVGYSVVKYELDGYRIGNLLGQRGRKAAVEVLATFLPRAVVDSLFASLQRAGLEVMSLTLEPIAASAVVIPAGMRMLNIALVDIGAGTSDIALSADGTIIAYDMVPVAGDEVTEAICHHYLLDFSTAELVKRSLTLEDEVTFTDVLGVEHTVPCREIIEKIQPVVESLAEAIAEKIIALNGGAPQAVILIGGGSLTPGLPDKLAEILGLSRQRVSVRGREALKAVVGEENLSGPESVTPIGIALTAYRREGLGFAKVTVNNQQVRLFEINRSTVADALLAAGINLKKVYPRIGLALTATVNGELKIIKGTKGKPAVIKVNGEDASLDTPVKNNDEITFIEAVDGEDASGVVGDVLPPLSPLRVYINEKEVTINPVILMNNRVVDRDTPLEDGATITYELPSNLGTVMSLAGMEYVNEEDYEITVNGIPVELDAPVSDGDHIKVFPRAQNIDTEEVLPAGEEVKETGSLFSSRPRENTAGGTNSTSGGSGGVKVTVNGEEVVIDKASPIFADVIAAVDFSARPPKPGSWLVMEINGLRAEFTTPVKDGDEITIYWEER